MSGLKRIFPLNFLVFSSFYVSLLICEDTQERDIIVSTVNLETRLVYILTGSSWFLLRVNTTFHNENFSKRCLDLGKLLGAQISDFQEDMKFTAAAALPKETILDQGMIKSIRNAIEPINKKGRSRKKRLVGTVVAVAAAAVAGAAMVTAGIALAETRALASSIDQVIQGTEKTNEAVGQLSSIMRAFTKETQENLSKLTKVVSEQSKRVDCLEYFVEVHDQFREFSNYNYEILQAALSKKDGIPLKLMKKVMIPEPTLDSNTGTLEEIILKRSQISLLSYTNNTLTYRIDVPRYLRMGRVSPLLISVDEPLNNVGSGVFVSVVSVDLGLVLLGCEDDSLNYLCSHASSSAAIMANCLKDSTADCLTSLQESGARKGRHFLYQSGFLVSRCSQYTCHCIDPSPRALLDSIPLSKETSKCSRIVMSTGDQTFNLLLSSVKASGIINIQSPVNVKRKTWKEVQLQFKEYTKELDEIDRNIDESKKHLDLAKTYLAVTNNLQVVIIVTCVVLGSLVVVLIYLSRVILKIKERIVRIETHLGG